MTRRAVRPWVSAATLLTVACSSSGAGNAGEVEPGGLQTFTQDVGVATPVDFEDYTHRILGREQYEVIRFETGTNGYVETQWRIRNPLPDEIEQGVIGARSRILLRTRPRARATAGTLAVHRITFMMENLVQYEADGDWQFAMSEGFLQYARRISKRFETEFRAAIRRYD